MEAFSGLILGLKGIFTGMNMGALFIGTFLGTVVGILPGLGPAATMAVLLPLTAGMGPAAGLIMLGGIFFGCQYGGSTTSILLNIPGEASSVMTCLDGHQMAKKGRAGAALTAAAIGSFIAAQIGIVGLTFLAMPLARFALRFGPPEYFAITLVGLLMLTNVSGGSFAKNMIMAILGIMLGTVGMDPTHGEIRLDFGIYKLAKGIDYIPVLIGLFGIAEIFAWLITKEAVPRRLPSIKLRDLYPTSEEWRRMFPPIFRGGILGFLIGLLPGPGPITSTYVSYALEKKVSKRREEFGHGAIEGVAGPESANNAASIGQMVPLLSLGLPFTALTAMMLGAIMMQGITPGPLFIVKRPDVFWVVVVSFYLGNFLLVIMNLPFIPLLTWVLRTPMWLLMAVVTLMCIIGTYAIGNEILDIWVMLGFGVMGLLMRWFDYQAAPLVLGMVFGPLMERSLLQSMIIFQGNPWRFFERPLSGTLFILAILGFLIFGLVKLYYRRRSRT